MGKLRDLRDKMYEPFIQWMKTQQIDPDDISMDAWGYKMLSDLDESFREAHKNRLFLHHGIAVADLKKIIKNREEAENKARAKAMGNPKVPEQDIKIVDPHTGQPVRK